MSTRNQPRKIVATIRAQVWIERGRSIALSEAGADLLEQIDANGSLSQAARTLRYSYRRAWVLLDAMNRRWDQPLVRTAIGGRRGGGAQLTEFGHVVLRSYRDLQLHVEALIDQETAGFLKSIGYR
jgi:molybdate transport system regulatory protein